MNHYQTYTILQPDVTCSFTHNNWSSRFNKTTNDSVNRFTAEFTHRALLNSWPPVNYALGSTLAIYYSYTFGAKYACFPLPGTIHILCLKQCFVNRTRQLYSVLRLKCKAIYMYYYVHAIHQLDFCYKICFLKSKQEI